MNFGNEGVEGRFHVRVCPSAISAVQLVEVAVFGRTHEELRDGGSHCLRLWSLVVTGGLFGRRHVGVDDAEVGDEQEAPVVIAICGCTACPCSP